MGKNSEPAESKIKALIDTLTEDQKESLKEQVVSGTLDSNINDMLNANFFICLGNAARIDEIPGVGFSKELKDELLKHL